MWGVIGRYLLKAAIWALQNPQAVEAGIQEVHVLVDEIHQAKQAKQGK